MKCVIRVAFNQFILWPTAVYFTYQLLLIRGCELHRIELPGFAEFLFHLFVFSIVEEIGFYYAHRYLFLFIKTLHSFPLRLLHYGPLYRNIHKIHHEFTSPIGNNK
jgi:sterol desaturase/sphingolipid hydroxylase (fatty acid hydroxylase superfamily)